MMSRTMGAAFEPAVRPPPSPVFGASMKVSTMYFGLSIGKAARKALKFWSLA
ncbi:hypothetical protein D3C71_2201660 [compost metagenome]